MKNTILYWSVLILSFQGFGQALFPRIMDTNRTERTLIVDGSAEVSSTALDNQIINRFLMGGEITSGAIDENSARQKLFNRGGVILSGSIVYSDLKVNLFKNEKLGFGVQLGYDQIASATYTDHLFDLAFKGNKEYANSTMDITSSSIRNIAFQKVGFGVYHKPTRSSLYFNVVNVSSYMKGTIDRGTIRQSENLDTLTIDAKGSFSQPYKKTFSKGMGFSFDFNYNIPIRFFKNDRAFLQAQVRNLGVAYIEGGVKTYRMDSTYDYNGFTVQQLFDGAISSETGLMDTLGIQSRSSSKWIALPFYLQLSKEVNEDYEGKFQSVFGLRVYPIASYRPLIYAGADYRPIQGIHIGLIAAYGGFSTFRGTFYLHYNTKRFGVGVGMDNIVGTVYKRGLGQTYNLRLTCRF